MSVEEVIFIPCGFVLATQNVLLMGGDPNEKIPVPIYSVFIRTSEANLLIDTGLNPDGIKEPEKAWGPRAKLLRPVIKEEDDIRNRLKEIAVTEDKIDIVINTHLHWDHTGGNRFFKSSKFLVQKSEYRFALYPDTPIAGSYMKNHFDFPLNYELVEGDQEIVEGINLITSPGHTPGHQSVLIYLRETMPLIVAADAIYTMENVEKGIPPGNQWSLPHAMDSMAKLRNIVQREKGHLIPGHEPNLWKMIKPSPYRYTDKNMSELRQR